MVDPSERETKEEIIVQEIQVILPPDSEDTPVTLSRPKNKVFTVLKWVFGVVWFLGWAGFGIYFAVASEMALETRIGLCAAMCLMSPWILVYDFYELFKKKQG